MTTIPSSIETLDRRDASAHRLPGRLGGDGRRHRDVGRRPRTGPVPKTRTASEQAARAPADSTPQPSHRGARNMRLHAARRWQDRQDRQHTAESGSSFQIKGRAPPGRSARVLAALRAAPPFSSSETLRARLKSRGGLRAQGGRGQSSFFSSSANITRMPLGPRR